MKKSTVVASVLGVGLVVSLYANMAQHSTVNHQKETIKTTQAKRDKVTDQLSELKQTNRTLNTQIDSAKVTLNNSDKSASEIEFNEVTDGFLKSMFNYDAKSYDQRKNKVKEFISGDLYDQYFPKQQFYGDSNNVTSKLDKADVYTKSKQGTALKGLAVIDYESKTGDNDFRKDTVVYELTFDTTNNVITDVQNLGHVFKGTNVQ